MVYAIIVGIVLIIAAWAGMRQKAAYYSRIFSVHNYEQIEAWVRDVVSRGLVETPSMGDGSATITDAGVVIGYTRVVAEGADRLHFSVSERRGITTHSVGGRMCSYILQLLRSNTADANGYYTRSGVHHLVLERQGEQEWIVTPVPDVIAWQRSSKPLKMAFDDTDYITDEMKEKMRRGEP